ncbi:nuclear transport factor 2 family protein [Novosphingobium sp. KCTC 2891]|uniref:nuclear transport factor 2 family protein n=1 Tax=Novosphingobium sp. KCTC 2891 TaxID=2989730 RepID=UPI002221AA98|nr:nuclear transport factor 2 family protein [Novosphingobium sp. KCTC 2891]MCW1384489.1 nuclear transport factor 2 family protein [Novosphingobium sp. KCTC 2891]
MSTEIDPRLARLLDKQDCIELVHRLARAIDRCDAELVRAVFHPDATDDHGSFKGTASDFVPWVMDVLAGMRRTQHVIGNVLVEIEGDVAHGEAYFIAHHCLPGSDGQGDSFMVAAGRYLDRFERRGGEWRIAHRGAVYDWSSTAPSTDMWDRAAMPGFAFGARGAADPSYRHFAALPERIAAE